MLIALGAEQRSVTEALTWERVLQLGTELGGPSPSGVRVSKERALSVSAWWRGIAIRSSYPAKIGPPSVQRKKNGGWEDDLGHPANAALSSFPGTTPMNGYRTCGFHRMVLGNAFYLVDRDGAGDPTRLILLDPDRCVPFREGGADLVAYAPPNEAKVRTLSAANVWHSQGITWDGRRGLSVVAAARDTLGSSIAMRQHGSKLFANFARLGVILEHPGTPSAETKTALANAFDRSNGGVDNAFKSYLLTEGIKVASSPTVMNPEDAQLIEGRTFEVREIANFVGVPPHRLGDVAAKTYASIEQDNQAFIDDTIDPDLVEMEQSLGLVLLSDEERRSGEVRIRFDRDRLIQADAKSQAEADSKALAGVPWKTRDEIRARRGLPPLPDGEGAKVVIPINLVQAAEPGSPAAGAGEPPPADPAAARKARAFDACIADTRGRMTKRLTAAARAAAKSPAKFTDWIDSMREAHEPVLREAFAPAESAHDAKAEIDAIFTRVRAACDAAAGAKASEFHAALERELGRLEASP